MKRKNLLKIIVDILLVIMITINFVPTFAHDNSSMITITDSNQEKEPENHLEESVAGAADEEEKIELLETENFLDLNPTEIIGNKEEQYSLIESGIVVVMTEVELKAALQTSNIHTIYLGADIRLTDGIQVNDASDRTDSLIIDGQNPYGENPSKIYTLEENTSNTASNIANIHLRSNNKLKNITLRNMKIVGRNYYGVFCFSDDGYSNGRVLTFDNIEYTGPQPIHIINGTSIIKDSIIYLNQMPDNRAGEVGEATQFILDGEVYIYRTRTLDDHRLFNIYGINGGILIKENAKVVIDDQSSQTDSGLYHVHNANTASFIVEKDASISYLGYRTIGRYAQLKSFEIGESAEVMIEIKGNLAGGATDGAIYTNLFSVAENAKVQITALDNSNTAENPLINTNHLVINNPNYMLVFNNLVRNSMNAIYASSADITTDEIRHWKAKRENIDDIFTGSAKDRSGDFSWYQEDGTAFQVVATASSKNFSDNYIGAEGTATNAEFVFMGTSGIAYGKLNGIRYDKGAAEAGEVPSDSSNPYRVAADVIVLGNEGNLSKSYSEFLNWKNERTDGVYQENDVINLTDDIVLTAQFIRTELQVDFNAMAEGVENPTSIIVKQDQAYGELPQPRREGYIFAGWYDVPEGGNLITEESKVIVNENHTLFARWTAIYTLNLYYVDKDKILISSQPEMNQIEVTAGTDFEIVPEQLDGYQAQYYMINNAAEKYNFTVMVKPVSSIDIFIYYASTMMQVEFPVMMDFQVAYADRGHVVSNDYQVENYSDLPVKVAFKKLTPVEGEMDGIDLVSSASEGDELHLDLLSSDAVSDNGFSFSLKNIQPNEDYSFNLGVLSGNLEQSAGDNHKGVFQIGGFYSGKFYLTPRNPNVNFTFHYELVN